MSREMPAQKPGRSKQNYGTPPEFLDAVKRLLDIKEFAVDLAADQFNTVAQIYLTKEMDALSKDWREAWTGAAWINPPYDHIAPWVKNAYECKGYVVMLVPASVGSNWWRDWVHNKAHVWFLNGRLTFVGCTDPYPKDCALIAYQSSWLGLGWEYDVWTWNPIAPRKARGSRTATPSALRRQTRQTA